MPETCLVACFRLHICICVCVYVVHDAIVYLCYATMSVLVVSGEDKFCSSVFDFDSLSLSYTERSFSSVKVGNEEQPASEFFVYPVIYAKCWQAVFFLPLASFSIFGTPLLISSLT